MDRQKLKRLGVGGVRRKGKRGSWGCGGVLVFIVLALVQVFECCWGLLEREGRGSKAGDIFLKGFLNRCNSWILGKDV